MNVNWPIAQTKWQNEHSAFVFDPLETVDRRFKMKVRKALSLVLLLVLALTLIPSAVAGSSAVVPMQAQGGENERINEKC